MSCEPGATVSSYSCGTFQRSTGACSPGMPCPSTGACCELNPVPLVVLGVCLGACLLLAIAAVTLCCVRAFCRSRSGADGHSVQRGHLAVAPPDPGPPLPPGMCYVITLPQPHAQPSTDEGGNALASIRNHQTSLQSTVPPTSFHPWGDRNAGAVTLDKDGKCVKGGHSLMAPSFTESSELELTTTQPSELSPPHRHASRDGHPSQDERGFLAAPQHHFHDQRESELTAGTDGHDAFEHVQDAFGQ